MWFPKLTLISFGLAMVSCRAPCPPKEAPARAERASSSCDHLSPASSTVANPYNPIPAGYDGALAATLFQRVPVSADYGADELLLAMVKDSVPGQQEAAYLLIPSKSARARDITLIHAKAAVRITGNSAKQNAVVTETTLDRNIARRLEQVWSAMTRDARWPSRQESQQTASMSFAQMLNPPLVHFTFDYRGDNVYFQGTAVSPQRETCRFALSDVGETLIRLAAANVEERGAVARTLERQVARLAARLEIRPSSACGGAACRVSDE
jgi:hypothetical protein